MNLGTEICVDDEAKVRKDLRARGTDIHKIVIRFPRDLWDRLKSRARRQGVSANTYVNNLVAGNRGIDEGCRLARNRWDKVITSAADLGSAISRGRHDELVGLQEKLLAALTALGEQL